MLPNNQSTNNRLTALKRLITNDKSLALDSNKLAIYGLIEAYIEDKNQIDDEETALIIRLILVTKQLDSSALNTLVELSNILERDQFLRLIGKTLLLMSEYKNAVEYFTTFANYAKPKYSKFLNNENMEIDESLIMAQGFLEKKFIDRVEKFIEIKKIKLNPREAEKLNLPEDSVLSSEEKFEKVDSIPQPNVNTIVERKEIDQKPAPAFPSDDIQSQTLNAKPPQIQNKVEKKSRLRRFKNYFQPKVKVANPVKDEVGDIVKSLISSKDVSSIVQLFNQSNFALLNKVIRRPDFILIFRKISLKIPTDLLFHILNTEPENLKGISPNANAHIEKFVKDDDYVAIRALNNLVPEIISNFMMNSFNIEAIKKLYKNGFAIKLTPELTLEILSGDIDFFEQLIRDDKRILPALFESQIKARSLDFLTHILKSPSCIEQINKDWFEAQKHAKKFFIAIISQLSKKRELLSELTEPLINTLFIADKEYISEFAKQIIKLKDPILVKFLFTQAKNYSDSIPDLIIELENLSTTSSKLHQYIKKEFSSYFNGDSQYFFRDTTFSFFVTQEKTLEQTISWNDDFDNTFGL